jgi:hypothetical protein
MKRPVLLGGLILLLALGWTLRPFKPGAGVVPGSLPSKSRPLPVVHLVSVSHPPSLAAQLPLNSPSQDITADLELLSSVFESFRTNFPREGNPVGENAEITAVLTGANSLHLVLVPAGHPAINQRGELCDRWGTPFFFHQISGTQMEIQSAGPDRIFHTSDDVILRP